MPRSADPSPAAAPTPRRRRFGLWAAGALLVLVVAGLCALVADELRTSRRQAAWLAELASRVHYEVLPGRSPAIRFPGEGPFDTRFGYHALPLLIDRLERQGFGVTAQARMSPALVRLVDQGLFPIYHEKTHAGLAVHDCGAEAMFEAPLGERRYQRFEAVPPLLVDALLFIENRGLLDDASPATRNPAVDWQRFGKALADQLGHRLGAAQGTSGGSTLATQIEKYRHSPDGRTATPGEKLRQMASASVRAYLDGEDTLQRRRRIVVDYLDTVPLAAQAGFGEVHGIGDGLWAWYGRDFAEFNERLAAPLGGDPLLEQPRARAFKQALSLMIAQRRPSHYLRDGHEDLARMTDSYLRVMAQSGVISAELRDAALAETLERRKGVEAERPASFVERKAANAVRARVQELLGMGRAYDVDRLDLTVGSTLDAAAQQSATELLRGLARPEGARAAGLYGHRLLRPGDDPSRIAFSFTLFQRSERGNLLRVQADNLDQPFDLNEGARLDLGSTAKLRTLVTYLELVAQLHERWKGLPATELEQVPLARRDAIGRWARDHLLRATDKRLETMLDAAMGRPYSASPGEVFLTGGGLHRFDNFDHDDDGRRMSVREAFTRSVNLVFIRLMRDIVQHVMARDDADNAALLEDAGDPKRRAFLVRFADKEGTAFLSRFYRKYAGKRAEEAQELLLGSTRAHPRRLAAALWGVDPQAGTARLAEVLARRVPAADRSPEALAVLHEKLGPGRWSLPDRGYLAAMHPLELWLVAHLRRHPEATLGEVIAASREQRQEVYGWLFKTRRKPAQDARIRQLLEADAFAEVHRMWRRLGYPFESLTPSYASAIGASGDRPSALAELMGIVVNRGVRRPATRVASLHFARATPYETRLEQRATAAERVLPVEVAEAVRRAAIDVVDHGTAKRLKGALAGPDGRAVDIGAKTGTGDHRVEVHGAGGRLVSSRIVGRSATLMFLIGDRWYGTIMANVREPYAADYKFTSALVVQVMKAMAPALREILDGGRCRAADDSRT